MLYGHVIGGFTEMEADLGHFGCMIPGFEPNSYPRCIFTNSRGLLLGSDEA